MGHPSVQGLSYTAGQAESKRYRSPLFSDIHSTQETRCNSTPSSRQRLWGMTAEHFQYLYHRGAPWTFKLAPECMFQRGEGFANANNLCELTLERGIRTGSLLRSAICLLSLSQATEIAARLQLSSGSEQWDTLCRAGHLSALYSSMMLSELYSTCMTA